MSVSLLAAAPDQFMGSLWGAFIDELGELLPDHTVTFTHWRINHLTIYRRAVDDQDWNSRLYYALWIEDGELLVREYFGYTPHDQVIARFLLADPKFSLTDIARAVRND